jgi:formate dehydrogenase subunit gamma
MTRPANAITRYTTVNRINHWINAILFVMLVISGLSMFHPILFWFSELFGGGQWTRAAHPWFGVCMVVSWIGMFIQFWRHNLPNRDDVEWSKAIVHVVANDDEKVPPIGRNNAGQKLVFWSMALLIPILFVTGLLIWEVYFGKATSIETQRVAVLIHSLCAFAAILVLVTHIYAGIWIRHSVRSMTQGWVTPGWAWHHHRKWFRQVIGYRRGDDTPRKHP